MADSSGGPLGPTSSSSSDSISQLKGRLPAMPMASSADSSVDSSADSSAESIADSSLDLAAEHRRSRKKRMADGHIRLGTYEDLWANGDPDKDPIDRQMPSCAECDEMS